VVVVVVWLDDLVDVGVEDEMGAVDVEMVVLAGVFVAGEVDCGLDVVVVSMMTEELKRVSDDVFSVAVLVTKTESEHMTFDVGR